MANAIRNLAADCSVHAVSTEAAAAAAIAMAPWDIVVVDLMLAEGQGFNVILHGRRSRPDALIVVLSEFAAPHVADRCVRAGADAVFRKTEFGEFARFVATRALAFSGGSQSWEARVTERAEQSWNTALA